MYHTVRGGKAHYWGSCQLLKLIRLGTSMLLHRTEVCSMPLRWENVHVKHQSLCCSLFCFLWPDHQLKQGKHAPPPQPRDNFLSIIQTAMGGSEFTALPEVTSTWFIHEHVIAMTTGETGDEKDSQVGPQIVPEM